MKILYGSSKVELYCNNRKLAQKEFNEKVATELSKLMVQLKALSHIGIFQSTPALARYGYHGLYDEKGKPKNRKSMRLDFHYRLTLIIEVLAEESGEDTIKILEVTNHYGD